MENVVGGKRGIAASESGIRTGTAPEGTDNAASKIAELERAVERLTVENAELKADREESNARLTVPEAECSACAMAMARTESEAAAMPRCFATSLRGR